MGAIRGFFLFTIASLLFVALFAGNILLTLTLSLQPENVQTELSSFVSDVVTGEIESALEDSGIASSDLNLTKEVDEKMQVMEDYCENKSDDTNYVFSYEEYTFEVPCEKVEQGITAVVETSVEDAVEDIYYKEYECEMWDCISEGEPYVLVSQQAKEYWKAKYYTVLLIAIGLAILTFFVTEKKKNFPILLGVLMVVSGLPFLKAQSLVNVLSDSTYGSLASVFISEAPRVFWFMFIPGVILILIGVAFHTVIIGTKFGEWLERKGNKIKETKKPVKKK